jgi:hypothetical protein
LAGIVTCHSAGNASSGNAEAVNANPNTTLRIALVPSLRLPFKGSLTIVRPSPLFWKASD